MKHFNRYSLAMLPLLSVLAMSPSTLPSPVAGRSLASLVDKGELPKIDVEGQGPDAKQIEADLKSENKVTINKEKIEAPEVKAPEVSQEPSDQILCVDSKPQNDDADIPEIAVDEEKVEVPAVDSKIQVDDIKPEVAKVGEESQDDLPPIDIEKEKIDIPKIGLEVQDIKPDIKPIVTEDVKLSKSKRHRHAKVQNDDKEEVCGQDEKVKVLSGQVEALIASQNQIMQSLLNMTQMMMMQSMMIQQQMILSQLNSRGTQQSPYQYANQTTAGNWVYYPQGFQPSQPNIFAQPQPQIQGLYPDQTYQQPVQSSWNLSPGTFGPQDLSGGLGFNMAQSQIARY